MNIDLQQLLPANISDEAALHMVNFVRNLSIALESVYFDNILRNTRVAKHNPFDSCTEDEYNNPF
jgi:hypothetical protein